MILNLIFSTISSDVAVDLINQSAATSSPIDWTWIITVFTVISGAIIAVATIASYFKPLNEIKDEALRKSEYIKDIKDGIEKDVNELKSADLRLDSEIKNMVEKFDTASKESLSQLKQENKLAQEEILKQIQKLIDDHKKYLEDHCANINCTDLSSVQELKNEILNEQEQFAKQMDDLLRQMLDMVTQYSNL